MSNENDLSRIKEIINEIEEKSADGSYIFRGEPEPFKEKYDGKVSSSLWREYRIEEDHFNVEVVQMEMIEAAKKHTGDLPRQFLADLAASLNVTGEYIGETTDFEILTEIQHYGGKTNLIDFSTDYLIALFFACDGSHDKNGRIILLQRTEEKNSKYQIEEPRNPRNRVISQKSVFVRPPKGYVETEDYEMINIPKSLKQPVLTHLSKYHSISTESIYNDLHGFIRNQDIHGDAYTLFYRGFACQNRCDEATTSEAKMKESEKSIKHYTKAIELKPDFPEAYTNRGNAYIIRDDYDNAIKDYNRAIQLKSDYANAYYNRGNVYNKMGKYDFSIKDYDMAIQLGQDDSNIYYGRGVVYNRIGDFERAIEDFDKVIQFKPNDANAYYERAAAYYNKGAIDFAIEDFTAVIRLTPDRIQAHYNRGLAYSIKGAYDLAIEDLTTTIQLKSDYTEAYHDRGVAHYLRGKIDLAIEDYNKAIQQNPDCPEVYYNRGIAYEKKDNVDSAIKNYDKAIELKPDYAEVYNNRGYIYYKKGEYALAVKDYDVALKLKGNSILVYNNRSMALLHLQEWKKAKSDLIITKDMGTDIVALFRNSYSSIADFEQKTGIQLPPDIAEMLTPPQT